LIPVSSSKLEIIYEDGFILVVSKPSCLHSTLGEGDSLARLISLAYPEVQKASLKLEDCGLVNRLDFETSGLVLVAKQREVWEILFEQLKASKIEKEYLVLLEGHFKETVVLEGYVGSRYRGSQKVSFNLNSKQRFQPIRTELVPLGLSSQSNVSLAIAIAHRATRHQVRVSCSQLSHPLVGDKLYGSSTNLRCKLASTTHESLPSESLPNFLLHAWNMSLEHPKTGQKLRLTAPIPQHFLEELDAQQIKPPTPAK